MLEKNTDRLFWTITAVIVSSLVLTITVKLFPNQARAIKNAIVYSINNTRDHKTVDDPHYDKVHATLLKNQKDTDDNSNYKFSYSSSDDTATVVGYKSIPDNNQVIIPKTIKHDNKDYQVVAIAPNSFAHTKVVTVVLPEGLTTIGINAFAFSNISTLILPSTVTSIQQYAFDTNQLTTLSLPMRSDLHIDPNAFTNNQIKTVTLPNKDNIDIGAFDKNVQINYQLVNSASKVNEVKYDEYSDVKFQTMDDKPNPLTVDTKTHAIYDSKNNKVVNSFVQSVDGDMYYTDANGIPITGTQFINGHNYYFDYTTGIAAMSKIVLFNGNLMYYDDKGYLVTNKKDIEYQGNKYDADANGNLKEQSNDDSSASAGNTGDDSNQSANGGVVQ